MKVICIDDKGYISKEKLDGITEGNVYDVISVEFDDYIINDDNGNKNSFFRPRFKIQAEKIDIVAIKVSTNIYLDEKAESIIMNKIMQVNDDNFNDKIECIKKELLQLIKRTESLSQKEFINECINRVNKFAKDQYPVEENWYGTMKFDIKLVDAKVTKCKKDGITIDF